jgi:hypothetical protein
MCMVFVILHKSRSKSWLIHWSLAYGGTGGPGGQGGEGGGLGGTGEGAKIEIHDSNVNLTNPDATSMLFYGL